MQAIERGHPRDLSPIFLALADPTRLAVIDRLSRGPASVSELARPFDIGLPTFMKHVRFLETNGIIRTAKRGRTRTCTINESGLARAESWLAGQRAIWEANADRLEAFVLEEQAQGDAINAARKD